LYPFSERQGSGFQLCEDADQVLDDVIVSNLQRKALAIERYVKKDPNSFCHVRGFLAKQRACTIDPSIDALKVCPPNRTVLFARSKAAEVYFSQYQSLEGIEEQ